MFGHRFVKLVKRFFLYSLSGSIYTSRQQTRHQVIALARLENIRYHALMMMSSNGNIFHVTGPLCGEFTGPGEFPTQRPVTRSFDVFFDLRLNKRLSKQPWGWWFETPSWSLWRQCIVFAENVGKCLGPHKSGREACTLVNTETIYNSVYLGWCTEYSLCIILYSKGILIDIDQMFKVVNRQTYFDYIHRT